MGQIKDEIMPLYETEYGRYYIGKCEEVIKNLDLNLYKYI